MRVPRSGAVVLLSLTLAGGAAAQSPEQPGRSRPELPDFVAQDAEQVELPLVTGPGPGDRERLSAGLRVLVREFRVVGSSVFPPEELAAVTRPYTDRRITSEELIEVRDAVTQLYVEHGYLSSGALIPDQRVEDGVVEIRIVEGRLEGVSVGGAGHFRPAYLRSRARPGGDGPLNVQELARRLQLLQQDPRIRRIDAELAPGARRGSSLLSLAVEEESPWDLRLELSNDLSPSLGGERAELTLAHRNLTGSGDTLRGIFSRGKGLYDVELRYEVPLNRWDTTLGLHYRYSASEVVEAPFDDLDIESHQLTAGLSLRHPLYREPGTELLVGVIGELERSEASVLGVPFSYFASQLDEDGESRVSALRFFSQWTRRSRSQIAAARLAASIGVDLFDATIYRSHRPGSSVPDGRFVSWLLQLQWARRLPERYRGSQLVFRTDLQLARDPLLPLERFSIGGRYTVRGYHENELVRDNGMVASLELRVPLLRDPLGRDRLQLAPFIDFGRAWNETDRASFRSIASVGLGLRYALSERLQANVYWGSRLRRVDRREGDDLQDAGLHIELRLAAF